MKEGGLAYLIGSREASDFAQLCEQVLQEATLRYGNEAPHAHIEAHCSQPTRWAAVRLLVAQGLLIEHGGLGGIYTASGLGLDVAQRIEDDWLAAYRAKRRQNAYARETWAALYAEVQAMPS